MVGSFITVGTLAGCFLALAALVWGKNGLVDLDRAAHRVGGLEAVDGLFAEGGAVWLRSRLRPEDVVHLGARTPVILMACVLVLVALAWRDRIGAVAALAGPGLTGALTEYVIKPLVNSPSPVGARTFPSGHAGGVVAVALVALILSYRRWGRLAALLVAPLAAAPVLFVWVALLRLDFHYPTDVVGGGVLAATVVFGVVALLSLYRGPGHHLLRQDRPFPVVHSVLGRAKRHRAA